MNTYNTLDALYNDAHPAQLTAQKILNGRAILNGRYQDFAITPELRAQVIDKLTDAIGGRKDTPARVRRCLTAERPQHWALERFYLEKYGDRPAYLSYGAGQDQTYEMRALRQYLAR